MKRECAARVLNYIKKVLSLEMFKIYIGVLAKLHQPKLQEANRHQVDIFESIIDWKVESEH